MDTRKVYIIITQAENAGAQKAVLKLYAYLYDTYDIMIYYLYVKDQKYYSAIKKNYLVDKILNVNSFREYLQLFSLRKKITGDNVVVITYTHWANIIVPLILAGKKGLQIIANKRGLLNNFKFVRFVEGLVLKSNLVNKVICVSRDIHSEASDNQKIDNSKLTIIPNAVDLQVTFNNQSSSINQDILKVLFVGRLHKQKGISTLLEGFNLLKQTYDNIKLTICGEGVELPYIKHFLHTYNLSLSVTLAGNVKNISNFYSSHDLLLSTSIWEGFPNVLLEAASHRLPIIATDIGGSNELINHKINGYLIKHSDANALYHAILYFIKNRHVFHKYADDLFIKVKKEYNHNTVKEMYYEVIQECFNELQN